MGVESATCLSPQGELSRVPPATEHRRGARRAPALEAPGPAPRAPCGAPPTKPRPERNANSDPTQCTNKKTASKAVFFHGSVGRLMGLEPTTTRITIWDSTN